MIDHVLGRPSVQFRKIQVFAVVIFWSFYLNRGDKHGPPFLRRISSALSNRLTAWQTLVITLLWLYVARNFGKLVGLECPEPLSNLYSRSYFRATWVTTALDAGFWSAMRIRKKWLRDICSLAFSVYYMVCAEQADEKVRKVRGCLTVDHLRVSWNKGTSPYLGFFTSLMRPRLMRYPPRALRIPRPKGSQYREPTLAWLYFDGPLSALKRHEKVVLDIPGGGFVAMGPRNHDDKLIGWAGKTGLPVLSLDYKKAPEYPYPYALEECYDVYQSIISTKGKCIGLSGDTVPHIVVAGDSAGGNLAVGLTLMILQSGSTDTRRFLGERILPPPEGLVLIYPGLDMNIGNWMTDEQMALIRDRRTRKTNQGVLRQKSDDYRKLAPDTPHHSDEEEEASPPQSLENSKQQERNPSDSVTKMRSPSTAIRLSAAHTGTDNATVQCQTSKPQQWKTRLAMASMISYFNDRILTPEMMRAMIILYIGPHNRPDFSTDFLLSPLLAPEALLARFPKTYFLTGERDPLVDDTVIFAGRIRQAKQARLLERKELGLEREKTPFWESEHVEVVLIPGISHGFLQFVPLFPEGWKYVFKCAKWIKEIFESTDREEGILVDKSPATPNEDYFSFPMTNGDKKKSNGTATSQSPAAVRSPLSEDTTPRPSTPHIKHHFRTRTSSSGDEDLDRPLEMTVKNPPITSKSKSPSTSPSHQRDRAATATNGTIARDREREKERNRVRRNTGKERRRKSLVSLASEEDLLGRRMRGLTGSLISGMGGNAIPPTP